MKKKIIIVILTIFFSINFTNLLADPKLKIIENLKETETLKFHFNQISLNNKEEGICFLKRPYFLRCEYKDKNQKQLIINKKTLVIFHKRYNKIYRYPVSKSYFLEILDKKKFANLIYEGNLKSNKEIFKIEYSNKDKGKIIFYFDNKNYNLSGWEISDLNNNSTVFKISNLSKNHKIDEKIFIIPSSD